MSEKKHEIIGHETLHQGWFRLDKYELKYQRFDESWTPSLPREVFSGCGKAAVILPFDPEHDKVALIEQFRPGPMAAGEDPWMLELVAGMIDPGETKEEAARREAREEALCTITDMQQIAQYYPSPGGSSEHISLFVGRTTVPEDGLLGGLAEENEDIRIHVMEAAKAISLLYNGKLRDAASLIAMQWFAMHHTELRSRWLVSEASTPII